MDNYFARITQAFRSLRSQGIIARQNFSCCRGCASGEITQDIEKMPEAKRARVRGAVYTTKQDVSGAHNRGGDFTGMWISFGARPGSTVKSEEIGQAIADALRAAGLVVRWDGDAQTRVEVCTDSTIVLAA